MLGLLLVSGLCFVLGIICLLSSKEWLMTLANQYVIITQSCSDVFVIPYTATNLEFDVF